MSLMAIRDTIRDNKEQESRKEELRKRKAKERGVADEEIGTKKREHFEVARMWVHYILSSIQKDRGKIPANIGNRMMVTNNMYITRYFLSSVIQVQALSLQTPITLQSELVRYLRKEGCNAVIDITMKQIPYDVKLEDSGLKSRIQLWKYTSSLEDATVREKEAAARCLYTVGIAESGMPLFKTRLFITVRAKTGTELTAAEKTVYSYLRSINAEFDQITGNLNDILEFMTPISDTRSTDVKNWKAITTSEQTIAEMLPNTGALNSKKGVFMGVDVKNGTPFKMDFNEVSGARNLYFLASSGKGKTVTAMNLCCSAVEEGYAVCIQDIKGNEFNNFIKATNGYVVSLRENSSGFINSWQMHKRDTDDANADVYFRQRLAFSKEQLIILSGLQDYEARNDLEELLDSFHDALYEELGVLPTNRNTWDNTRALDPFVIYDKLMGYMTPTVISKYPGVSRKVLNSLRMYMSRDGSKSYIFKGEFDYAAVLRANTIMFDFGMLNGSTELQDPVIFKLKFAYMRKLNAEYVSYKFSRGIKVFKVLEESQIVVDDLDIIKGYVEEITLRRAQGQTTLLLGNSVASLLDNPISKPIVENITGLMIGNLEKGARQMTIEKFGLQDYAAVIDEINIEDKYINSFVFINRMEQRPAIPIIRVIWNKVNKYKVFEAEPQKDTGIL